MDIESIKKVYRLSTSSKIDAALELENSPLSEAEIVHVGITTPPRNALR